MLKRLPLHSVLINIYDPVQIGIATGICCRLTGSGCLCEGEQLQEVVGGADQGPFGTHFLYAPQQELAETACPFELSAQRFLHLLSQWVGSFEAAVVAL